MPNGAVDPFGTPAPERTRSGGSGLMLMAMLVPTTILLSILTIFLLKQRRVQADRQGLVMTMGPGATTSDISDLLSDKIGRSTATTQTTRVNNTEQLEKLAKEKPTKVAELLKSTWLSDRER
jgi:flagellar biosynthesis/type III secretory pathway M-ring protein FliF/YscJ